MYVALQHERFDRKGRSGPVQRPSRDLGRRSRGRGSVGRPGGGLGQFLAKLGPPTDFLQPGFPAGPAASRDRWLARGPIMQVPLLGFPGGRGGVAVRGDLLVDL